MTAGGDVPSSLWFAAHRTIKRPMRRASTSLRFALCSLRFVPMAHHPTSGICSRMTNIPPPIFSETTYVPSKLVSLNSGLSHAHGACFMAHLPLFHRRTDLPKRIPTVCVKPRSTQAQPLSVSLADSSPLEGASLKTDLIAMGNIAVVTHASASVMCPAFEE